MNDLLRSLLGLPVQASTYARDIDYLHYSVITATMLGATFVLLLALYYLARHRRRAAYELTPRMTIGLPLELSISGSLLLLFLAFWVVGVVQYEHMLNPPADAAPIYVTGKQWMWKFAYPDGRASIDVLTVPAGRPIKLVMTSRDVIHSFYVPAFRMKHDVVPGRYYVVWFTANSPGLYDIDCAEYCGVDHSRMLGRVQVLSAADYSKWLEGHPAAGNDGMAGDSATGQGDLADEGRAVAARRGCFNCHTVDGQPHIGPSWAGLYGSRRPLLDGRTVVADDAYLTRSMMEPEVEIVAGYKPVMPTYRGALPEPEVAALVEFIKALPDRPPPPAIRLPTVIPVTSGQPREPKP
jgi:cytochrome c oxidase subunit 2